MELPKQIQDKINQFQGLQNQLQSLVVQKQQFVLQAAEIDNALKALKEVKKEKVYEVVGPIFVEAQKEKTEKKLTENKDLISTRLQILEKQEKSLTEKLQELSKEIQTEIQSGITAG